MLWFAGLIALAAADSTCSIDEPVSALQHSKRTVASVDPLGAGAEDAATNTDDTLALEDASIEDIRGQGRDHVIKVQLEYVLLMEKVGYGDCSFSEQVTTGFSQTRSTTSTVDARLTTKVEAAVYSVAASAEATLGAEFTNQFSVVETTTRTETTKYACPTDRSFYLYQSLSTAWFGDGSKACYAGALSSSNHPKSDRYMKDLDLTNVVHVESWRKNQMQYLCYKGHSVYYKLPQHHWSREMEVFYAFQKPEGGTVPIDVWRKGGMAYYIYHGHPTLTDSHMNRHHWKLEERGVFHAYRPDEGPHDALEVHVWRRGERSFFVTPEWRHWGDLTGWGWSHERLAFKVPKFGL